MPKLKLTAARKTRLVEMCNALWQPGAMLTAERDRARARAHEQQCAQLFVWSPQPESPAGVATRLGEVTVQPAVNTGRQVRPGLTDGSLLPLTQRERAGTPS